MFQFLNNSFPWPLQLTNLHNRAKKSLVHMTQAALGVLKFKKAAYIAWAQAKGK